MLALSITKSCRSPRFGFGRFFLAISPRRTRFKRLNQPRRRLRDFVDGRLEGSFIGLRRFVEATDLSNKLQRRGLHFLGRHRRIKVEKRSDVPAHFLGPFAIHGRNALRFLAAETSVCASLPRRIIPRGQIREQASPAGLRCSWRTSTVRAKRIG